MDIKKVLGKLDGINISLEQKYNLIEAIKDITNDSDTNKKNDKIVYIIIDESTKNEDTIDVNINGKIYKAEVNYKGVYNDIAVILINNDITDNFIKLINDNYQFILKFIENNTTGDGSYILYKNIFATYQIITTLNNNKIVQLEGEYNINKYAFSVIPSDINIKSININRYE